MVSLSIHGCNPSPIITHSTFPTRLSTTLLSPKPFPLFLSPKPNPLSLTPLKRPRTLPPPASTAAAEALETSDDAVQQIEEKEELRVAAKGMEKPRLVLRFVWMEKNIGLGLDREIPGHGTVPLSPYYWWPRKDAWEELKSKLEEKPWVSQKRMIILLNQATDIINLWQQSSATSL